jgi:2-dehydrotetronate isomerase
MPKFSANLGFLWSGLPLHDQIDAAARAGFKAIEVHWPYDVSPESVRDHCDRLGLKLLGLNTSLGDTSRGDFGLGALIGREADFDQTFNQSVDYCRRSGANAIHVMAGVVAPEDRHKARETFIGNLRRAAEAATDLTLLLEPLNQRDKPGYFYSTIKDAAEIIGEVGAPNVKVMFDIYHVGVSEGDIFRKLDRYLPLIGHVQIAAVPSRAEPDEGEIAYATVFRELDTLGYDGWVGCEYRPRGNTDDGLGWVKALGVAL